MALTVPLVQRQSMQECAFGSCSQPFPPAHRVQVSIWYMHKPQSKDTSCQADSQRVQVSLLVLSKGFKGSLGLMSSRFRADPYKNYMVVSVNWGGPVFGSYCKGS